MKNIRERERDPGFFSLYIWDCASLYLFTLKYLLFRRFNLARPTFMSITSLNVPDSSFQLDFLENSYVDVDEKL